MNLKEDVNLLYIMLNKEWYKWVDSKSRTYDIINRVRLILLYINIGKNDDQCKILLSSKAFSLTKDDVSKCFRVRDKEQYQDSKGNMKIYRQVACTLYDKIFV